MNKNYPTYIKITILLFLFILIVFSLIEARDFLYPIALAILFSGLLFPVSSFLERKKFPKALAILTSIFMAIIVIGSLVYLLTTQLGVFIDDFDEIKSKTVENTEPFRKFIEETTGLKILNKEEWSSGNVNKYLGEIFSATTGTIVKIGLQPVYVFFFLFYRKKFFKFFYKIVPENGHDNLDKIIAECGRIAKGYLGGLFVVVMILCVLNSAGLYIIGLKYALLFGILSAVMNFIPYFGTLIGGAIPLTYAAFVEPEKAIYVLIFFAGVQFLENNVLTPRITGGQVNLNPIITILTILTGSMIWGIPGMFLSVPALAVIKSICSYIDSLKPIAYLLDKNNNGKE